MSTLIKVMSSQMVIITDYIIYYLDTLLIPAGDWRRFRVLSERVSTSICVHACVCVCVLLEGLTLSLFNTGLTIINLK